MINPFITSGYAGPEYFCDREAETKKLIGALKNGRNVAYISPRRLGKTGLILHAFNRMQREDPDVRCFYVDIFPTQSELDFINLLSQSILGKLDSFSDKILAGISSTLKHSRPVISVDPMTGKTSVSLNIIPGEEKSTLEDIVEYMENSGHQCYVAIDEFQQVREYPQQGIDAALRTRMQLAQNVHFIFAGSKKHLMSSLFSDPSKPLYQCVQKMGLDPLPEDTYYEFARKHMSEGGKNLPKKVFSRTYSFARGYTWYIQDLMNRLYELPKETLDESDLEGILYEVKQEGETTYKDFCELLAKGQLRLLRAIAVEDCVKKPLMSDFLVKYDLGAASSVRQALKAMVKANIVAGTDDGYYIYDRYLSLWLRP